MSDPLKLRSVINKWRGMKADWDNSFPREVGFSQSANIPYYELGMLCDAADQCDTLKAELKKRGPLHEKTTRAISDLLCAEKDRHIDALTKALESIIDAIPALTDGGGLHFEHYDTEGNYTGSENVDPMRVIQSIAVIATNALHPTPRDARGETK